MHIYKYMAHIY